MILAISVLVQIFDFFVLDDCILLFPPPPSTFFSLFRCAFFVCTFLFKFIISFSCGLWLNLSQNNIFFIIFVLTFQICFSFSFLASSFYLFCGFSQSHQKIHEKKKTKKSVRPLATSAILKHSTPQTSLSTNILLSSSAHNKPKKGSNSLKNKENKNIIFLVFSSILL